MGNIGTQKHANFDDSRALQNNRIQSRSFNINIVPLTLQNRGFSVQWFYDGSDIRRRSFGVDKALQSTKIDDPVF